MQFSFLTLYHEPMAPFFSKGVIHRAIESGRILVDVINWRQYADPPHFKVDDAPFSKKRGMLLRYDILSRAIENAPKDVVLVMPDPKGPAFNHRHAKKLSQSPHVYFISPAFEGVDARIYKTFDIQLYRMGDFIVPNGDSACVMMAESIARYLPGVLGCADCIDDESIVSGLLENPQYTAPRDLDQERVPQVLLSGHHQKIDRWKLTERLRQTLYCRPDLLNEFSIDQSLVKIIDQIILEDAK